MFWVCPDCGETFKRRGTHLIKHGKQEPHIWNKGKTKLDFPQLGNGGSRKGQTKGHPNYFTQGHTQDTKIIIRKASEEHWKDPEYRSKLEPILKQIQQDPIRIEKVRKSCSEVGKSNKGKIPWNKGLTKEDHPGIAKMSENNRIMTPVRLEGIERAKIKLQQYRGEKGSNWQGGITQIKREQQLKRINQRNLKKDHKLLEREAKKYERYCLICHKQLKDNRNFEIHYQRTHTVLNKLIRKQSKERWENKEYRENILAATLNNPEVRRIVKDKLNTDESKKKESIALKEKWQTEDYVRKQMKARAVRPNKTEIFLESILNDNFPNEWKYVGDGEVIIGGKCPDFININGKKEIIELFGDYWHKGENPEDRKNIFKKYGYHTLVIWEHELKDIDKVLMIVKEKYKDYELMRVI